MKNKSTKRHSKESSDEENEQPEHLYDFFEENCKKINNKVHAGQVRDAIFSSTFGKLGLKW
jgi:hypothetical protein